MADQRWNLEDETGYREMTQRAAREAWELYRQGEEYRARRMREDAALVRALGRSPGEAVESPSAKEESPPFFAEGGSDSPSPSPKSCPEEASPREGPNPWRGVRREKPPPGPVPIRAVSRGTQPRRGLLAGGLDEESILLLILLFVLWQEKAEKEILLALLYILLV